MENNVLKTKFESLESLREFIDSKLSKEYIDNIERSLRVSDRITPEILKTTINKLYPIPDIKIRNGEDVRSGIDRIEELPKSDENDIGKYIHLFEPEYKPIILNYSATSNEPFFGVYIKALVDIKNNVIVLFLKGPFDDDSPWSERQTAQYKKCREYLTINPETDEVSIGGRIPPELQLFLFI